jgi:CheY-like chemotaxis protein
MILIVDDDEDVRATIKHLLDMLAYGSSEAEDGPTALAMVRAAKPDVVILDYSMPGVTGAEVASAIGQIDPGMPIIFASGYAEEGKLRHILGGDWPILHKSRTAPPSSSRGAAMSAKSFRSRPAQ